MKRILYIFTILLALAACSDHDWNEVGSANVGDVINIGGVATSPLEISVSENATRAKVQDAEEITWLIAPLKKGLDITYGKVVSSANEDKHERVAILKLEEAEADQKQEGDPDYKIDPDTKWAIYSFKYKDDGKDAIWYDNGEHYFEGMFVPDNLRYGSGVTGEDRTTLASVNTTSAPNITTDQSTAENYSYLEHYLAMPANTKIHATIGRVKLPFYHRLSRVIAYILIDPEMQTDPNNPVTLKGYMKDKKKDENGNEISGEDNKPILYEDPSTTSLRFCNVEVLTGVKDVPPTGTNLTDELTPQWGQTEGHPQSIRKVIPHFVEEEGSKAKDATGGFEQKDADFLMYYNDDTQEYIFPSMDEWPGYYTKYGKGETDAQKQDLEKDKVTVTNYHKVPVYDLIVRPTYDDKIQVMYDERNAEGKELSDDEKTALVTKKNKIDFELTLSNELIYTKEFQFDLNANEQTIVYLRISRESVDYNASGSELWIKTDNNDDWYGVDNRGEHSLSAAGSTWQRAYTFGATVSGDNVTDGGFYNENDNPGEDGTVGQYVTKETWIKKFAQAYEGGACHGDYFILKNDIEIDARMLPDDFVFTGHLDAHGKKIKLTNIGESWSEDHYSYDPSTDYNANKLYVIEGGEYVEFHMPQLYTYTPPVKYNSETAAAENASHQAKDEDGNPKVDEENNPVYPNNYTPVKEGDIITPESWNPVNPTLAVVKEGTTSYYEKKSENTYEIYNANYTFYEYVNHPINHTSGSALFAGLNGAYTAENGKANVHSEGGFLVPYTDGTTGWRAEVMNLKVEGLLFPESVYTLKPITNGEGTPIGSIRNGYITDPTRPVSGNVQNCYDGAEGTTKVPNHTPALFRYN